MSDQSNLICWNFIRENVNSMQTNKKVQSDITAVILLLFFFGGGLVPLLFKQASKEPH